MYTSQILIIGAGKVGTALSRLFNKTTGRAPQLYDIRPNISFPSKHFNKKNLIHTLSAEVIAGVQRIFIAVQDDHIQEVVQLLKMFNLQGKLVVHTSGSAAKSLLNPLKKCGAAIGAMHPMRSFSKHFSAPKRWKGTWVSYEGNRQDLEQLKGLFPHKKVHFLGVNAKQKRALHIAGVLTANYSVTLLAKAEALLKGLGIKDVEFNKLLASLLNSVVINAQHSPAENILTGPIARGDIETIKAHLTFLQDVDIKSAQLYKALAIETVEHKGFKIAHREKLQKLLQEI